MRRELESDLEHVLAEQGHPGGAVGLLQMASGGQWRAAVENADIVEPEKPALEEASAKPVLAVHPPAEIRRQPAEHPLQKIEIGLAAHRLLHAVEKDRCPGLYRRIDVAEIPLIGRDLPGRMQVEPGGAAGRAAAWRNRCRRSPRPACERPGPRRQTTDIPTCPASR